MDLNKPDEQAQPTGGQEPNPGYSYDELQKQSIGEIAEGKPVTPEPPKEPETPATPQPTVEEIAEQAARKVLDEQETKRVADEETKKKEEESAQPTDEEKAYLDWEAKFKAQENRPPTYREALTFVKGQTKEEIKNELKAEQDQAIKEQQTREEEATKTREAEQTRVNTIVDDELADLYNANKLTKIQDPNNPNDQGVLEKKALFETWMTVNNQRRAEGKTDIISATRIYEFYYKKPNAQPAGGNAPVQGNHGSSTPTSGEQEYSYADLKKPWSWFGRK